MPSPSLYGLLRRGLIARLVAGSALNAIGSWAALIALWGYAAVHFRAGANGTVLVGLAWALPGAVLSPLAGLPVDRFGPTRTLLVSNIVGVGADIGLAFASTFAQLLTLSVLIGAVAAAGKPAAMALPARLVDDDDLLGANSLLSMAEQSAIVIGPVVGSVTIGLWGMRSAFLVDAATFTIGALSMSGVHGRTSGQPPRPADRPSSIGELADAVRLARTTSAVRWALGLSAVVYVSFGAFFVIEPLYVRLVLHRSPAFLGAFQATYGVGLLAMTALLPRIGDKVASVRVLAGSAAASGAAAAMYVGTHSVVVAAIGVFVWGADVAFFLPPMQTLLQRSTPTEAHGRVLALSASAGSIGFVAAIPVAGALVAALGVSGSGAAVGGLSVLAGAYGLVYRGAVAALGASEPEA